MRGGTTWGSWNVRPHTADGIHPARSAGWGCGVSDLFSAQYRHSRSAEPAPHQHPRRGTLGRGRAAHGVQADPHGQLCHVQSVWSHGLRHRAGYSSRGFQCGSLARHFHRHRTAQDAAQHGPLCEPGQQYMGAFCACGCPVAPVGSAGGPGQPRRSLALWPCVRNGRVLPAAPLHRHASLQPQHGACG